MVLAGIINKSIADMKINIPSGFLGTKLQSYMGALPSAPYLVHESYLYTQSFT